MTVIELSSAKTLGQIQSVEALIARGMDLLREGLAHAEDEAVQRSERTAALDRCEAIAANLKTLNAKLSELKASL